MDLHNNSSGKSECQVDTQTELELFSLRRQILENLPFAKNWDFKHFGGNFDNLVMGQIFGVLT